MLLTLPPHLLDGVALIRRSKNLLAVDVDATLAHLATAAGQNSFDAFAARPLLTLGEPTAYAAWFVTVEARQANGVSALETVCAVAGALRFGCFRETLFFWGLRRGSFRCRRGARVLSGDF